MFIPNGVENGIPSWTVRFYYDAARGYVADYVTVNAMLPIDLAGNLGFAGGGTSGSLWMPLLEKAYAQWNETGREGRDGRNSYTSLNGGWMQNVDSQVLGLTPTTLSPTGDPATKQALIDALESNAAVTAAIFGGDTEFNALGLVSGHAYDVVGYDADPVSPTFDTFRLKNPWGFDDRAPLTWDDLCAYCPWLAVADAAPSVSANSQAGRALSEAVHAAALKAVVGRQFVPDAACLASIASNADSDAPDTTRDAAIRALELVLAESGR